MNQLKEHFKNRNINLELFPEVEVIVNNPIETIKKMTFGTYCQFYGNHLKRDTLILLKNNSNTVGTTHSK